MSSDRSRLALCTVLVAAVLTSGCVGVLTGSEPAVFEASPAEVSEEARAETDFQPEDDRVEWTNRTVEVAGQEREVRVRNHVALYERPAVAEGPDDITFGVFAVVATPQASIAGQALNPIGRMDPRQLVEQIAQQQGNLRDVQREGTRNVTVLGTEEEVVRFSAVAEQQGVEVPVYVEVTRVSHDGDFVIALGIYPQGSDELRSQVTTLFRGVEH